jgi:hypothetical protein
MLRNLVVKNKKAYSSSCFLFLVLDFWSKKCSGSFVIEAKKMIGLLQHFVQLSMDGSEEEKISSVQPCMCPILIFGDFVHLVV